MCAQNHLEGATFPRMTSPRGRRFACDATGLVRTSLRLRDHVLCYPWRMETIADIDLMGDERLRELMTLLSLLVLVVGLLVALALGLAAPAEPLDFAWLLALAVVSVASLVVHELIHAASFKLLGGRSARVSFGARDGLIYTSAAGSVLPRARFVGVLLAPTVVLSAALLGACCALGLPLLGWCLFALHLSGCVGDLLMAGRIVRARDCTHVRDTEYGCELLRAAAADAHA